MGLQAVPRATVRPSVVGCGYLIRYAVYSRILDANMVRIYRLGSVAGLGLRGLGLRGLGSRVRVKVGTECKILNEILVPIVVSITSRFLSAYIVRTPALAQTSGSSALFSAFSSAQLLGTGTQESD